MALSNSQYNELMRIYEQRQLDAVHQVQERYERVTQAIPEFAEIDNAISSASIRQADVYKRQDLTGSVPRSHNHSVSSSCILLRWNNHKDLLHVQRLCTTVRNLRHEM